MSAKVFTVGDFIRRVVDSLLRGGCRGKVLCSRCLVKLAKDHLDKSYTTREVGRVMDGYVAVMGTRGGATAAGSRYALLAISLRQDLVAVLDGLEAA